MISPEISPEVFVKPGVTVNHHYYRPHLLIFIIPEMHRISKNQRFTFKIAQGFITARITPNTSQITLLKP